MLELRTRGRVTEEARKGGSTPERGCSFLTRGRKEGGGKQRGREEGGPSMIYRTLQVFFQPDLPAESFNLAPRDCDFFHTVD